MQKKVENKGRERSPRPLFSVFPTNLIRKKEFYGTVVCNFGRLPKWEWRVRCVCEILAS